VSVVACCDANGVVEIFDGTTVPEGLLPVFRTRTVKRMSEVAPAIFRYGYDGKTLLVPGVPEAENDSAALDALIAFRTYAVQRAGVFL
jgi:hypothetical protein